MANSTKQRPTLLLTRHARARMQQRSFSQRDVDAITRCGTQVPWDGFVLTRKDVARETNQLTKRIKEKERQLVSLSAGKRAPHVRAEWHAVIGSIRDMTAQIQNLRRLENRKVVVSGGCVITCYVCSRKELKRSLRLH